MEDEYIVHVDSKNRDLTRFPYGNTYVLDFVKPISGVMRVDLISARVPNSMYNLNSNTSSFTPISIPLVPGFYSASTLEHELNIRLVTETNEMYYAQHEGKFYYLTNDSTATVSTDSDELAKMLGIEPNKTYIVEPLPVPINSFYYAVKSEHVVDFSLNEYVFLDIEELRGPHFCDVSGNAENTFAVIPMDVEPKKKKEKKITFGKWAVFIGILGVLFFWYTSKKIM